MNNEAWKDEINTKASSACQKTHLPCLVGGVCLAIWLTCLKYVHTAICSTCTPMLSKRPVVSSSDVVKESKCRALQLQAAACLPHKFSSLPHRLVYKEAGGTITVAMMLPNLKVQTKLSDRKAYATAVG